MGPPLTVYVDDWRQRATIRQREDRWSHLLADDPEELHALAAIVAAAQLLWARPAAPEEPPAHDAWRFSGRWWAQPALVRRARPWARP